LPLRVSGVPVPVSVVAAVVGNLLLVALAARLTGSRLAGGAACRGVAGRRRGREPAPAGG
jgi:hypothetical protein